MNGAGGLPGTRLEPRLQSGPAVGGQGFGRCEIPLLKQGVLITRGSMGSFEVAADLVSPFCVRWTGHNWPAATSIASSEAKPKRPRTSGSVPCKPRRNKIVLVSSCSDSHRRSTLRRIVVFGFEKIAKYAVNSVTKKMR